MDSRDPIETKVNEARFFLNRMIALDNPTKDQRPIGEAYFEHTGYLWSAFLGASRAIYQRLEKSHPPFRLWYNETWLPSISLEDRALNRTMTEERNFEIHLRESTRTEQKETVRTFGPGHHHTRMGDVIVGAYDDFWGEQPGPISVPFPELFIGDFRVHDAAKRYLDLLERMVKTWRSSGSVGPSGPPLTLDQKYEHADTMFRTGGAYLSAAAAFSKEVKAATERGQPLADNDHGPEWAWLQLICQGIEVSLKGFLMFKNYDHYTLKHLAKYFGHDIFKLATETLSKFGLSPMNSKVAKELQFISDLYCNRSLRYGVFFDPQLKPKTIESDLVVNKLVAGLKLAYRVRNKEAMRLHQPARIEALRKLFQGGS